MCEGDYMKADIKTMFFSAVFLGVIFFQSAVHSDPIHNAGEPRFADIRELMVIYRSISDDERIEYGEYVVTKVDLLNREKYSSEYNYPDNIEAIPEGYITVSYYSGKRSITGINRILDIELPEGKIGGLRLASMWLKRSAEDRANSEKYHNVITVIMKKSDLTWQEVVDYYTAALGRELSVITSQEISANNKQGAVKCGISAPLVKYYTYPSDEAERELVSTAIAIIKKDSREGDCLVSTMIRFGGSFSVGILKKIQDGMK